MPDSPKTREAHHSFTVRVPESLYTAIGDLAAGDNMFMNTKVNQLLRLSLGLHVSLTDQLRNMIVKQQELTDE